VVVPILAPNMIPMPATREIRPALRKEMAMTETSELDCITVVLMMPKLRLFQYLSVVLRRMDSSVPPVKALNPSSIESLPNKKMATPAEIPLKSGLIQKP